MEEINSLIHQLISYETETDWFEFKHNNYDPEMIGQDISALANSALFSNKSFAYMIWGIDDKSHKIIGTQYNQYTLKVGNQEIESWLRNLLSKNVDFEFIPAQIKIENTDVQIVVLKIQRAINQPVSFRKVHYIRIGSYTKKLIDYPQVQTQLWDKLRSSNFEEQLAIENLSKEKVVQLIDYTRYFELAEIPIPSDLNGIVHYMIQEKVLFKQDDGNYSITNMGAILFAKKLSNFSRLERKTIRVVQYDGNNKLSMQKQIIIDKGYVQGFIDLMQYMDALLPSQEIIKDGLRERHYLYPQIALREIIANAIIHQDFSISGCCVVIEVFSNRIEITNPGVPLIDVNRIVDNPPKSRNEKLASLMRRLKMCEELGTGWDKIIISCEMNQIPAPLINIYEENTKVVLFSSIDFFDLSPNEKIWTCYMHACIKFIQGDFLTNSSLRERFCLEEKSSASISRLIKEVVQMKLIKKQEETAPKHTKYIPFWA